MDVETIKAIGQYIITPVAGFASAAFVIYVIFGD